MYRCSQSRLVRCQPEPADPFQYHCQHFPGHQHLGIKAQMTEDVLQAFADAWNRHDVDELMSFMTDGCVFEASAGPDMCGTLYNGREEVRAGFAEVWATFRVAHWGWSPSFRMW